MEVVYANKLTKRSINSISDFLEKNDKVNLLSITLQNMADLIGVSKPTLRKYINTYKHDINNNDNLFYFHICLNKKKISIQRSYDNKNFKFNKIKNKLDNYYNIELKNNDNNLFSVREKLFKNNKEIFDYNSIKLFNNIDNNIYISIYITSKNQMINKNEYLNLNFE